MIRALVLTALLAAGAWSGAVAAEPIDDRKDWILATNEYVFPSPDEDRAVLYLLRPQRAERRGEWLRFHLDERPLGFLPGRSYMTVRVEPGTRLLWTRTKSEWFAFQAGRSYVLVIDAGGRIEYQPFDDPVLPPAPSGSIYEHWRPGDPAAVRDAVISARLAHVRTTEGGYAALRKGLPKRYKKAVRLSPPPPGPTLPAAFKSIRYRNEPPSWTQRNTNLEFKTARGRLSVTTERVRYEGGGDRLDIGVERILQLDPPTTTPNGRAWVVLRYRLAGGERYAFFQSAREENDRIYLAILEAMQRRAEADGP